ncbi:MAG: hypothetical protein HYW48_01070 [Deltaproteobacteria bacterium]|nr:hypothetical protein [Deltaproteobacteria bacterium]
MKLAIALIYLFFGSSCARRIQDPLLSTEEKCNIQTDYVWLAGKCVRKRSAVVSKVECESRSDASRWVGETCISLDEILNLQKECSARGKGYFWGPDPKTGSDACVSPTTEVTPAQECSLQGDLWLEGRCIPPEGVDCIRNGKHWSVENTCITDTEKVCRDRLDGSQWIKGRCVPVGEQECWERGFYMRWYPPTPGEGQEATGTCAYKKFIDYCTDNALPPDYLETVNIIKQSFKMKTITCEFVEQNLSAARSLTFINGNLKNLYPLASYSLLTGLNVSNNKIEDLTPLVNMTNLVRLDLNGNLVSNLVPISELKKLRYLALGRNAIVDVQPLTTLLNLESLFLNENKITDINVLGGPEVILGGGFKKLHTLNVSGNCGISDISNLDFLNLKVLGLRDTMIRENVPSKFKDAYKDGTLSVDFSEEGKNKCVSNP